MKAPDLEVVVLPTAFQNLDDITNYLSHTLFNPSSAHRLVNDFYKKVAKLKDNPELYPIHESESAKKVFRKITLNGYLVFYTATEKYVYVAFILHSLQDVDRILKMY